VSQNAQFKIKNNIRKHFQIYHHKGGALKVKKLTGAEKRSKKNVKQKSECGPNGTGKWVVEVVSSQVVLSDKV
jgi:hypothetical protein